MKYTNDYCISLLWIMITSHLETLLYMGFFYISFLNQYCLNFCLQLIQCDLLGLFTMALRVCFLLFEGLRVHLKFQMEVCSTFGYS